MTKENERLIYTDGRANVFARSLNLPKGDLANGADNWYQSEQVIKREVTFKNTYEMSLVANLFVPRNLDMNKQHAAIIVGSPMGAVKEQSGNLYATKLAEFGFVTVAFDQVFWGESDGASRNNVAPDLYGESFSSAADYLTGLDYVDADKIGVLGVCGSGGFAVSEAKIDSRLKAIATASMYDMGELSRTGLENSQNLEERAAMVDSASKNRNAELDGAAVAFTSGASETISDDSDPIAKEYFDFYRTQRGAANTTTHPRLTGFPKFLNFYPFNDIDTIKRPMLFIAGDQAHSLSFSKVAYEQAAEPKELYLVKGAGHVDLYDRTDLIPFEKLNTFFTDSLK